MAILDNSHCCTRHIHPLHVFDDKRFELSHNVVRQRERVRAGEIRGFQFLNAEPARDNLDLACTLLDGLQLHNIKQDVNLPVKKPAFRLDNRLFSLIPLITDDDIFVDTDGGAITVNLPAGVDGKRYRIINVGTSGNAVTLSPNGAELLTGENSSFTLLDKDVMILTYETTEGWW